MKKSALLAAAAALMIATPAAAGGYVGGVYGSTDIDSDDVDTWQLEGAFGHNAGGWGFQVDGSIGSSEDDDGDEADHHTLSGHLYFAGGGWRLGGVITSATLEQTSDTDELQYGVEGSFDFGPNTVATASATFGEVDFGGADVDSWNVDGALAFYVSPNFRIGGNIGFGNLDAGGGADADTFSGGLGAEFQPWSMPVSFTVGWNHYDLDDVFLGGLESDTLSVGARWNFSGTLRDRDNAVPFDTRTGLFSRAFDLR